jgi:hypothetical protein
MTDLARRLTRNHTINTNDDDRRKVIDLTNIGSGGTNNINDDENSPNLFCDYCSINNQLIKKLSDIKLFGKEAEGATRFICPSCGTVYDPMNLEDRMNNLKRGEKGQTIRSNNSSSSGEGVPYAEMFSTNVAADNKDNLRGTQINRSLQNLNDDPDGPNEEANLRSQNMIIKKTITEYPESGRTVVKTYDDDND